MLKKFGSPSLRSYYKKEYTEQFEEAEARLQTQLKASFN